MSDTDRTISRRGALGHLLGLAAATATTAALALPEPGHAAPLATCAPPSPRW
ncbi:MAG TPA: hypothetical protein VFH48_28305 [Chloroflexota bacterium]|nr:hypothetical protein [Chloroflexota bacterium]